MSIVRTMKFYPFRNIYKNLKQSWLFSVNEKVQKYEIVLPQKVSEARSVPIHIEYPKYVHSEEEKVPNFLMSKSRNQIELLRKSCQLARQILVAAGKRISEGITTDELDAYIHNLIVSSSAYPSPLFYKGFPKSICTSVNNVVTHGIPDDRPLVNGDIVSVDVTVYCQGFHGDCAATFLVGEVDEKGKYLVKSSEEILLRTIAKCKPGEPLAVIAETVSSLAKEKGLCVIPSVCGHGIGQYFHEYPMIVHDIRYIGESDLRERLVPRLVFTIEPVIGEGGTEVVLLEDGWTIITEDGSRTAQFEHTIVITDNGADILTK